jgi:hypothetical protein
VISLARSLIAIVIGALLLIAMLCALTSETARDIAARRRMTTLSPRNPRMSTQS